jgi:glycosyltransferase involved in cell wall biosynthesis
MHIVHVITGLGQGGAETMLEKLLLAARQQDPANSQEVISLTSMGVVGPRLLAHGVRVRALGLGRSPMAVIALMRLVSWLRQADPNTIVQTWMYHADLVGGVAARLAWRRRVVWNLRQSGLGEQDISAQTRSVVRLCGWLSRWVPARIVTNAKVAIAAHAPYGYDTQRCVVIPNGFDLQVFQRGASSRRSTRAAWQVSDSDVLIGMVARMDPQKDHANFVATARIVVETCPAARFVLVGRGIPGDAALRALIASAGLSARFVLQDQGLHMPDVMNALDVFCLSSRAEGFPNVLGEAMACETPSVTTDAGDARWLLGDDALVAPVADAAKLAACVLRVALQTPEQRARLGQQQRERIAQHFDIHAVWRQYLTLYQQLT